MISRGEGQLQEFFFIATRELNILSAKSRLNPHRSMCFDSRHKREKYNERLDGRGQIILLSRGWLC
jgi:hypothetical protein